MVVITVMTVTQSKDGVSVKTQESVTYQFMACSFTVIMAD